VSADGKDRMSYADALGVILSPYGRLVQVAGRWAVLDSRVTQSEIYCPREKTSSDWRQEGYMDIVDISRAIANTENTRSVLAAPAKTTYSYSPEESKQKYDGDVIYEFGRKNIKSYYSIQPPVDVEWDKDGIHHRVRYMRIGENNLDQPISVETHQMQTTWTALDEGHVRYLLLPVYAPGRVQENRQWAQPCENVNNQGWKALKDQTYMFDRYLLLDNGGLMFTIIEDIVTMKLHKEVSTSNEYILKIEREIKSADMLDDADFSDVAYRYTYFLQPFMQIYWSPVPWGEGVVPQKVFRFPLFLPNPEAKPEWTDCDGFFFPTFCTDSSMIPSFAFTSGGLRLFLPENRGYIAIRMYGSGWPIPGDLSIGPGYKARINNAGPFILSDLSISNDSWIGTTPTRLLEWNTENDTSKQFTYDNGAGDISLQFKTLAGDAPTSATFLTPRRGFDDSMRAVTSPREMIDIGAVQVTENGGIPGITRFSLFEFDSKTYFPVAIGMNARDNTVALKLIRTL
jgi:hypothetical protein